MVGTAFFRSDEEKCPQCGDFGEQEDDHRVCPSCNTVFNEYVVLQEGQDTGFQNN